MVEKLEKKLLGTWWVNSSTEKKIFWPQLRKKTSLKID